ncbi:NodT family efflux transporter outer membrane factor (OMF) lipoprotein [Paucimonas lemoignei]|uniref:NodT family efflux transporter outer membrane factor (OMF) lipoprotein n=1 Tax=Paucimonas lemoignei TaxID=29443 RepID=A0A4R3I3S4_PAULE|nr:TolC family protein [Paucimonas lemoignei]TCS39355.1 NodT family efflux transporter outer membrane factor (OMF) lipoprotein [Paucimonas lemoignei]
MRKPFILRWLVWRTLCAVVLCAAATACTVVGPNYHVPENAAIHRNAAAAGFDAGKETSFSANPLPPKWWQLYRDPKLDSLIEKAFAANTDLRIAAANLARAHAALEEVADARNPVITANAGPNYGRESGAALGSPVPLPNQGGYDVGARVSYQVDLFGKIARAVEAARADEQAAQAGRDLAHVTVAADTARAYADVCSTNRQMSVAQRSIDLQSKFVGLTEKSVRAGRGSPLDVSRARAQLEQLRAALPPLQSQHRVALYRLAVLTGEVPGTIGRDIAECRTPPRLNTPIPVGDGAALLRRRPDIRQAERALAGATARIGVATADLYPSISLGLSAGSTGLLSQFGAANAFRWSLGSLISWTLPMTGPARSRIAQAEAGSEAALARFDATVLNALRETESALTVYARGLDRNARLRSARDQSALASQQAHKLYDYGRTDFLTALDADRSLANAESALASSDAQLVADQVALFLALGGGWESESGLQE